MSNYSYKIDDVDLSKEQVLSYVKELKDMAQRKMEILQYKLEVYVKPFASIYSKPVIIYMQGWTPEFNDGEPCMHSTDFAVGYDQLDYIDQIRKDDRSDLWNHFLNDKDELIKKKVQEPFGELMDLTDYLLVPICDDTWGTNYEVIVWAHQGKTKVVSGEYNCGY